MALPDAAAAYYQEKVRASLSTLGLARRLWAKLGPGDFDQAWQSLGPQLTVVLSAGQLASVNQALDYVPAVLDELGVDASAVADVAPMSLVGVASDGRPLDSLLYQTVIDTRTALGQGASLGQALRSGGTLLDRIVTTQTADAGRAAESVASWVRPAVQLYIRACASTACPRCAVLAGKVTRMETAFLRHNNCHCFNVPLDDPRSDMIRDARQMVEDGDVTGLSVDDTQAIMDGADPARVINAHRGMSTEMFAGQSVKTTTALADRGQIRLRPAAIYQLADDRQHVLDLLAKYGYIVK